MVCTVLMACLQCLGWMIASPSKSTKEAPSCSWAWRREECVTCTWSSSRGTSTRNCCCIVALLCSEYMQGLEDLWHDAQRDDHHPGEQQGAGEEHTAQLDLFHASTLLPCAEDLPPGNRNVPSAL